MRTFTWTVGAGLALGLGLMLAAGGWAQERPHGQAHPPRMAPHEPSKPVRMTMEELHKHGGTPPGWTFALPAGDSEAGREAFIAMKCYTCHEVAGEEFPAHKRDVGEVGPDLTGMGPHHPAEYFAEAIVNPNAVVLIGEGYTGPDGLSRMPGYNDSLTMTQLIDLVAYLKSLAGHGRHAAPAMRHPGTHRPGGHGPSGHGKGR